MTRPKLVIGAAVLLIAAALVVPAASGAQTSAPLGGPEPAADAMFSPSPAGYGAGTTGGAGRAAIVVTTLADRGAGSLRSALAAGGMISFAPGLSGTINAESPLDVTSNTTVDGRGADITITSRGLRIYSANNVIVRNLKFRAIRDDSIAVKFGNHIWLDHLDMADERTEGVDGFGTDGQIDVTRGATDVTISWSKLADHRKVTLLGWQDVEGAEADVAITMHHNLFTDYHRRSPQARHGHVEVTNNVFDNWGVPFPAAPTSKPFAIGVGCGAEVLARGNVFLPGADLDGIYILDEPGCLPENAPAVREVDNVANGATLVSRRGEVVADPPAATAVPVDAVADVEASVRAYAGWQDVPLPDGSTTTTTTTVPPTTTTTSTTTTTTVPPTTTTTVPPTTTTTTTTTVPVGGTLRPDLYRVSSDKARIEWTRDPVASRYEWRVERCDGTVVVAEEAESNTKKISGLEPDCYQGFVRVIAPEAGAWEATPRLYLNVPEPSNRGTATAVPVTTTTTTTTTTVPPTTSTATMVPVGGTLRPDLYRVSSDKARIEWTRDPVASRYEWRVERCDGTIVIAEDSGSDTKKISGLEPGCYQGFVRVIAPDVGAWEFTPRLYLDIPEPDPQTDR